MAPDLHDIAPEHQQVHDALVNWARWCGSGRRGSMVSPMFRGWVPYMYPEMRLAGTPVDQLAAIATQRRFAALPHSHRVAVGWWYCYPQAHPGKLQRLLGVTRGGLAALVFDARQMLTKGLSLAKD